MRAIVILLVIVVAVTLAALVFYRVAVRRSQSNVLGGPVARQFKDTGEQMQYLASEAVDDAQSGNHVTLDYSVDSLQKVESILGQLHDDYARDNSSVAAKNLAMAYGAYIGEVIRKSEPNVRWEKDDPVGGQNSYPLIWSAGNSYPCAWAYRRIVNGPEDNIWNKYQFLKNHHTEGVTVVKQKVPAPSPTPK